MASSGLTTSGFSGTQTTSANKTSDIKIEKPVTQDSAKEQKAPTLTSGLPKAKRSSFAARKEDPALLDKLNSDESGTAGQVNGVSSFIDGYLRINKRRYGRRGPYVRNYLR